MNIIHILKLIVIGLVAAQTEEDAAPRRVCAGSTSKTPSHQTSEITQDFIMGNNIYEPVCIGFTPGEKTYAAEHCHYCEQQLGTTDYSFLHGVYPAPVGCSNQPVPGRQYVCCIN